MSNTAVDTSKLPPMLAQYLEYKAMHPDCLLFFQVGDFYEVFFDDAVTVSRTLNLTLTSRDKNSPHPIPMCGVPIAVIEGYVERLLAQRYSVAIVSQTEAPQNGKGPFTRALERIVTPGVKVLSNSAADGTQSIVAALAIESENDSSIAYGAVESGEIFVREGLSHQQVIHELQRLAPAEVILPNLIDQQKVDRRLLWVRDIERALPYAAVKFRSDRKLESLESSRDLSSVQGFSGLSPLAKRSVRVLASYIDEVTVRARIPIHSISPASDQGIVSIDAMTRGNLELVNNNKDGRIEGSLYGFLDCASTRCGSRKLRQWILQPLSSVEAIVDRLTAVRTLKEFSERSSLRERLRSVNDIERIAVRIDLGVVLPRELGALRDALSVLPDLRATLESITHQGDSQGSSLLRSVAAELDPIPELFSRLEASLVDNPPATLVEGGIFRTGFNPELDRLRSVKDAGASWVAELETRERERTGISSLKIKFNNVFGYFIEVTHANLSKVPPDYSRRQTTANSERFITPELKAREDEILGADEKAVRLERTLLEELKNEARGFTAAIRRRAEAFSTLDVFCTLAEVAERENWSEPVIDHGDQLIISEGRHPVLAALCGGTFVPNSVAFNAKEGAGKGKRCMVITGPNMGGKSTFLRQTALIVLLAQIGSFIPARSAQIGIVDKIFARIGASDNLREGESTFMVEMREASSIISNATERSLVLIDEIGRGTATLDGLALARSILEWMVVRLKSRVLFATHFHELTELEHGYAAIGNLSVGSVEEAGSILFTHQILRGAANRSYGLEVAELAGLPPRLMVRARELMKELAEREAQIGRETDQLSLFTERHAQEEVVDRVDPRLAKLKDELLSLNLNSLTPLEALNTLSRLRDSLGEA